MRRKQYLIGTIALLASSLVVSCGIPQEDYNAILAERDSIQAEMESLQAEAQSLQINVESLQDELDDVQNQIESVQNDLSKAEDDLSAAQSQILSLQDGLNLANNNLIAAEAQIAKMEDIILFLDDFEDGVLSGWNLEGDWSVIQESGNYILHGVGPCSADVGPQKWTNYTLEAKIKFSQSANVNFRLTTGLGMYSLNVVPEGLILNKKLLDVSYLAQSGVGLRENKWIDLKVEVKDSKIWLNINGNWLFPYTDPEPLLSGTIGFELPENSIIYVDDVIVITSE